MGLKSKEAKSGDRLSRYFKDLNESDLDSDGSEEECDKSKKEASAEDGAAVATKSEQSPSTRGEAKVNDDRDPSNDELNRSSSKQHLTQKLPSARDCLENKNCNNPKFLNLHQKKEINWDHSTNLKSVEGNDSDLIHDYKSNAVPPPSSYEPVTDSSIKVVDSEGRKRKSAADELEEQKIASKTCRLGEGSAQHTDSNS